MLRYGLRIKVSITISLFLVAMLGCEDANKHLPVENTRNKQPIERKNYIVEMEARGWETQLWVNGIIVCEKKNMSSYVIDEYVVKGKNRMKISAKPLIGEDAFDFIKINLICISSKNTWADGGKEEVVLEKIKSGSVSGRLEREYEFSAQPDMEWAWTKADVIEKFSDKDREEIIGLIRDLYDSLMSYDMQKFDELMEIVLAEQGLHYGGPPRGYTHKSYKKLISKWHLRKTDEIEMIPCGKIVVVKGRGAEDNSLADWIMGVPYTDKKPFPVPRFQMYICRMGFSKIKGRWVIVQAYTGTDGTKKE